MKPQDSKTFSEWMNHLGAEQQAQEKADNDARRRRALFGKILKVMLALAGAAAIALTFVYRVELGHKLHEVSGGNVGVNPNPEVAGGAGAGDDSNMNFNEKARKNFGGNLNEIRDFAKERDKLLEEFSGGK